nr:DNA internalization-related competence protein ComEC/Rec2 [Vibrio hepatarius]
MFERPTLWLTSPHPLKIGDQVTTQVSLKPIAGLMNNVGFDAEKFALSRSVVARASIKPSTSFFIVNQSSLRQTLYDRLVSDIQSLQHRGLIEALLFGVRHNISQQTWQNLQSSGLSHLIAISGLHIGIMFTLGWGLGRIALVVNARYYLMPLLCAMAFAVAYAWLAGFSIPTRRALLMCVLFCLLQTSQRQIPMPLKWLIILCILLVVSPFSSVDVSLWLSMTAVGIIFVYLGLNTHRRSGWKMALEVQVFIVTAMAPMIALLFHGVSLSAIAYNFIFVPWFSFVVVPLSFLGLLGSLLFSESNFLWPLVNLSLEPVAYLASLSDHTWFELSATQVELLICSVLIVFLSRWLTHKALIVQVVVLVCVRYDWNPKPLWQLIVLDVGHGLSVIAVQEQHALVYDTGVAWGDSSIAQQVLLPTLINKGVRQLDFFVISHFDSDHAGDWQAVVNRMGTQRFVTSQREVGNTKCVGGEEWQWRSIAVDVLWPPQSVPRAYNPQSCVIKLRHQGSPYSVLLPGDIDAISEWLLLQGKRGLDADILLVPHHGSKTSSVPKFIEAVSPEVAIASTAKSGRWELPHPAVVARYQNQQVEWLDTGTSGQIVVSFYSEHYSVNQLRVSKGGAWYRQMLRKGVE